MVGVRTAEKHNLEFEILSDIGSKVAKEYGIVFKLTDEVAEMYNQAFDLNTHNGDESNELPLAATYIIDENGSIIYSFLDADYRNRAEPSDLTKFFIKPSNMKLLNIALLFICILFFSCQENTNAKEQLATRPKFQNQAHELVYNMTQKVGDYQKLLDKKDVVYTYTYTTPDGKADITTEKYIFDGELSYGAYQQHERTLTELEGLVEQGYDGNTFWLKHDGKYLDDEQQMKRVIFNRKTNFYWFTMFQKLLDPGLKYEYLKEESIDGNKYDVVKITFETVNGKPSDIYQLYLNQETSLVDQFLFTVVDFNVMETPFLMKMKYEKVDGFLIPSQRKYTKATWEGENIDENWIDVSWTDIKFNTGLSESIFAKKHLNKY